MSTTHVKIPTRNNAGTDKTYHTRDCHIVRTSGTEYRQIDPASLPGWSECRFCAGDAGAGTDRGTARCPRCGESFGNLPRHLRSGCDGGDSDA